MAFATQRSISSNQEMILHNYEYCDLMESISDTLMFVNYYVLEDDLVINILNAFPMEYGAINIILSKPHLSL